MPPQLPATVPGKSVIVLYDGRCGFCKKSIRILQALDTLHRLVFANYHDPMVRQTYAQTIELKALNDEMHVLLPNGKYEKGFFAFRVLAWRLPLLWLIAPFLHLPGMSVIGTAGYRFIATHRPHVEA